MLHRSSLINVHAAKPQSKTLVILFLPPVSMSKPEFWTISSWAISYVIFSGSFAFCVLPMSAGWCRTNIWFEPNKTLKDETAKIRNIHYIQWRSKFYTLWYCVFLPRENSCQSIRHIGSTSLWIVSSYQLFHLIPWLPWLLLFFWI